MNRRPIVIALACAAVLYACAPRVRSGSGHESSAQPNAVRAPVAGGLTVMLTQISDAHGASFALQVTNPGKRTELRFPNSKTHDFVVLDDRDREVWRWSTGRLFTQTLQTRQLKTGDAVRYEGTWKSPAPGTYRVVAVLNSETHPEQVTQEFTVR